MTEQRLRGLDRLSHFREQLKKTKMWQLEQIGQMVFSAEVCQRIKDVKDTFDHLAVESFQEKSRFNPMYDDLLAKQAELSKAVRKDLGI